MHDLFLMSIEFAVVSINSTFQCLHIIQEFMVYVLCSKQNMMKILKMYRNKKGKI